MEKRCSDKKKKWTSKKDWNGTKVNEPYQKK